MEPPLTPTGIDSIVLGSRVNTGGSHDHFFEGDVAFATLYDIDVGDDWVVYHYEMLTGPVATPTADFYVSGVRHATLGTIIWQIRGAVAALVIQDAPDVDENIVDYLRAVYGVN